MTYTSVDVAFYQGNYKAPGGVYGVIAQVARCNLGSYSETTYGAAQVANARSAGKGVGFYVFNGNISAKAAGVQFGLTIKRLGVNIATDLVAIDCEDDAGVTVAWGPAQVGDFIDGVNTVVRVPWNNVVLYMNKDVNRRYNWAGPVSWGARLWYARPDGPNDQAYWSEISLKQDGLYNGVDADYHTKTFQQIIGTSSPTPSEGQEVAIAKSYVDASSRTIAPGGYLFLRSANGKQDQNVIAGCGMGPYFEFLPHVTVTGAKPGEMIEVVLVWENTKNSPPSSKASLHYQEYATADETGIVKYSGTFWRGIAAGDMVFVRVRNLGTQNIAVTNIACDTIKFV